MHSITFGEGEGAKNTWTDWGLAMLSQPDLQTPPVKTKLLEGSGMDGEIDLTTAITGYPVYGSREGRFEFAADLRFPEWKRRMENMKAFLHGQYMRMWLSDDSDWYYEGRFAVEEPQAAPNGGTVAISYRVGPYKWSKKSSTDPWLWDPFSFVDGVIGTSDYLDWSTEPPTVIHTGNGAAYANIPAGEWWTEIECPRSGSAPVHPVFIASGSHSVGIRCTSAAGTSAATTIQPGRSTGFDDLVLYRGKWLLAGRAATVEIKSGELDPSAAETTTVTGEVVTFDDGFAGAELRGLSVAFGPMQAESDEPASPTNILPLTGITGVTVSHSGEDTSDPDEISVTWEDGTGEIGVGTLDVLTGVLTITHKIRTLTGSETWASTGSGSKRYYRMKLNSVSDKTIVNSTEICSHLTHQEISSSTTAIGCKATYVSSSTSFGPGNFIFMRPGVSGVTDTTSFKAWLSAQAQANTPVQVIYELAEANYETVQLDPATVTVLSGVNYIWSDIGTITVTYARDVPAAVTVEFYEGRL